MYVWILIILISFRHTFIRKSPRWCVFIQAWGYIVITSYLDVFKGSGTLSIPECPLKTYLREVEFKCRTCPFHGHFGMGSIPDPYTKVVWMWWYTQRYLFLLRVHLRGDSTLSRKLTMIKFNAYIPVWPAVEETSGPSHIVYHPRIFKFYIKKSTKSTIN